MSDFALKPLTPDLWSQMAKLIHIPPMLGIENVGST
jgi:hypothetical protein